MAEDVVSTAEAPVTTSHGAQAPSQPPHRRSWVLKVGLEVVLITVGVFLALLGDQWRENAHDRQLAADSLRRFRTEIAANRKAVAAVKEYHVPLLGSLRTYLAADPKSRSRDTVQIRGLQPVFFEHTVWDLALATQSLSHIDSISRSACRAPTDCSAHTGSSR